MLGPVQVRRADGSVVAQGEWRTAKTLDLLRLLALTNGEPVPVATVIDRLWPDVDETRGRASLRTAASQLRKVLGEDCIDRRPGGLVLLGAWVDVQAYEILLGDAEIARRSGEHARVVAVVEQSEAMYLGDLDVPDTSGDWLFEARDHLRRLRCRALLDAAEAAASLCWMRDSLDLAQRAAGLDMCEEAARALMRAHAGVGELEKALRVFDRTRRELADRYGVDPSPQTRALHLQLLTGTAARQRATGVVGHGAAVEELATALTRIRRSGSGVVWLQGEPGSGRGVVASAACREAALTMHDMARDEWTQDRSRLPVTSWDIPATDVVVMPEATSVPEHALRLLDTLARQHGGVLVVPVQQPPALPADGLAGRFELPTQVVRVDSLDGDRLGELAEVVLQGTPSPRLLRHLRAESGGLSGLACRAAHRWLSEGRVVWSVDGLELADTTEGQRVGASVSLRRSLRLMSPYAEDVVNLLSVLDGEAVAEEIIEVLGHLHEAEPAAAIREALVRLVDSGHVVLASSGYRLRAEHARAEILAWMRPQLRQRLNRLAAAGITMDTASRVRLLMAAGEHREAASVAYAAMESAQAVGDRDEVDRLRAALAGSAQAREAASPAGWGGRLGAWGVPEQPVRLEAALPQAR